MIPPRYRGKVTGGRPSGRRRRHRLAILIELARFGASLGALYLALVCTIGIGLWLANSLNYNLSDRVAGIPVVRQLAIQSDVIASYGEVLLAIGLGGALGAIVLIHIIANLLVEDVIDR